MVPGPEQFGVLQGRAECGGSDGEALRPGPPAVGSCRDWSNSRAACPAGLAVMGVVPDREWNPRQSGRHRDSGKLSNRPAIPRLVGARRNSVEPVQIGCRLTEVGTRMPSPRSSKCASSVRHQTSTRLFGTIWPRSLGGPPGLRGSKGTVGKTFSFPKVPCRSPAVARGPGVPPTPAAGRC